MGSRIAIDLPPIRCDAENLGVTIHHHRTDGDIASFAGGSRLTQRNIHPLRVSGQTLGHHPLARDHWAAIPKRSAIDESCSSG